MSNTPVGRFRVVALLEGVSALALFGVAMPVKYVAALGNDPRPVYYVGWVHGVLFVLYAAAGFNALAARRWGFGPAAWGFLAAVVPGGTFLYDHFFLRREQAAEGAARAGATGALRVVSDDDVIRPAHPPTVTTFSAAEEGKLALVRALARIMDSAVEIPGTRIRVGLDSVLGLFPGVGDLIGSAVGGYIIAVASRLGVPRPVIWRMTWNLAVDAVVGVVPFVGDLLDVAWKANVKNVALMEQALADPSAARRGSVWAIVGIVALVLLLGALGAAAAWGIIYLASRGT